MLVDKLYVRLGACDLCRASELDPNPKSVLLYGLTVHVRIIIPAIKKRFHRLSYDLQIKMHFKIKQFDETVNFLNPFFTNIVLWTIMNWPEEGQTYFSFLKSTIEMGLRSI